jgi:hypothetical protein
MRLMAVREPEVLADAPFIELVPSDELPRLVARQNYAAARKALAKFGSAPANVFERVEDVPQSAQLLEFRRLAEADPAGAATLVKAAFGTTAAKVTEAAAWAPTRRKISDSILALKLAYGGGPRPLAELAALLQAMAGIESNAGGRSPCPTALTRAPMAGTASLSVFISGKSKATGHSLRGGASLSMQSLSACMSPAFASSMAFQVRASPSPSSNASIARVAL